MPAEYKLPVPGVTATDIAKAEDAAHASGDTGLFALAVRKDTAAALAADGEYIPLITDSSGKLYVNSGISVTEYAEDSAHVTGDKGIMHLAVRKDAVAALAADGDYIPLIVDASGQLYISKAPANDGVDIGNVDVASVIPGTGATNLGKAVAVASGASDTGVPALVVRRDTLVTLTPATEAYTRFFVDSMGKLYIAGYDQVNSWVMAHEGADARQQGQTPLVGQAATAPTNSAVAVNTGINTSGYNRMMVYVDWVKGTETEIILTFTSQIAFAGTEYLFTEWTGSGVKVATTPSFSFTTASQSRTISLDVSGCIYVKIYVQGTGTCSGTVKVDYVLTNNA